MEGWKVWPSGVFSWK